MFKILLKKQLYELLQSWFYDRKNGKARTKKSRIGAILLFVLLIVFVLGGAFTAVAVGLAAPFYSAGVGYLYFVIFGLISLVLGLFGTVISTYSALYKARDNDLLLSMPIPVGMIVSTRLFSTYLTGLLYSAVAFVPASAVYLIVGGFDTAVLIGNIVMLLEISLLVWILSCLLGFCVAKVSLKMKNRSFAGVAVSVLFMALYYFVYFKAETVIDNMAANAAQYGARVRGSACILYIWGQNGLGELLPLLLCLGVCIVLTLLTWRILNKTFLNIATATPPEKKNTADSGPVRVRSISGALLAKEFARFASSAAYMTNCGLGVLLLTAAAAALLIKGGAFTAVLSAYPAPIADGVPVGIAGLAALLAAMNDSAAPSISLEGKSLWLIQSLPIDPWQVLRAKMTMQLILTEIPMLLLCFGIVLLPLNAADKLMCIAAVLLCPMHFALVNMTVALKMPILDWSNEIVPIKQSGGVAVAIFGGWGYALLLVGGYAVLYLLRGGVGAAGYLGVFSAVTAVGSAVLYRWLKTRGTAVLPTLG